MKFKSFFKIYYLHRINKAKTLAKIYIMISLPLIYLVNKFLYPRIINLDFLQISKKFLYDRDLKFLFEYFNSDKGKTLVNQYDKPINQKKAKVNGHNYHSFYENYLSNKKFEKINILELGAFKGNATAAFYFYFKNAEIFSGDIFPDLFHYKSTRINSFYIDTSSENDLKNKLLSKKIDFDLIIEDAGHYLKDQIISLFILFPILKSNGIFVVEELDFPDTRKDMNIKNEKPTLREILISVLNKKDFNSKYITEEQKQYFLNNYNNIKILKGNYNEIAFITKK